MPVDQTDGEAIAAVITELRQRVLDGEVINADRRITREDLDSAALRLAALCLFDIGLAMTQGTPQPYYPEGPIHGIVRGPRPCPYCGIRAYRWRPRDEHGDTCLVCVGCDTGTDNQHYPVRVRFEPVPDDHASSEE